MLFQRNTLRKPEPIFREREYTDDRMAELDRLIAAGLGDVRPVQHRSRTTYAKKKYAPHGSLKAARLEAVAAQMRAKNAWRLKRVEAGKKGSRWQMVKMTPEQRTARARKAAVTRWTRWRARNGNA